MISRLCQDHRAQQSLLFQVIISQVTYSVAQKGPIVVVAVVIVVVIVVIVVVIVLIVAKVVVSKVAYIGAEF